jgi:Zn-dependent peptidase ImmA (M78 family)
VAAQLSPVTADVLRWAIEEDGRPVPELAEALRVDVDTVDGWTRGDAQPTRGQVTKLADVLKRPRALFFMPAPPAAATLPASFRHPPGDDHQVSSTARRWIRQARRVQHAVSWALRNEPPNGMPRVPVDWHPLEGAAFAREWLGVSDAEQASWSDYYAALRAWRDSLEDRGILVFVFEIGAGDVRGFSAWDDRAPLIVANASKVSPAARVFTLAHELGHLLTRQDSACVEPVPQPWLAKQPNGRMIERWCEEFAAALLMPESAVRSYLRDHPGSHLDQVRSVANRFKVSHRAAALRLIDLDYAPVSLYADVVKNFAPAPPDSAPAGEYRRPPRAVTRPREYGLRTIRTVLEALPPRDAMSILRVTVEDVRRIADKEPDVRVP